MCQKNGNGEHMEKRDEAIAMTFTVNGVATERLVTIGGVEEYDESGNKIYYKYSRDYEVWSDYDANGNCVHFRNSHGFECWKEYDSRGNITHNKCSDGKEEWLDYDGNGNKLLYKDEAGNEGWWKYDEQDRLIYSSLEFETWYEYDADGNNIHTKISNGKEYWYKYNAQGKCIYQRTVKKKYKPNWVTMSPAMRDLLCKDLLIEEWWEYDKNGKETHYKSSYGSERWRKYDANGNQIHWKDEKGNEEWYEYRANGILLNIKCRTPNGKEKLWEYDECGNRTHYVDTHGNEVWDEYDESGNHIHQKDFEFGERWWVYDFWRNGKIKRCVEYILVDNDDTNCASYKQKFLEEKNETAGQSRCPKGIQRQRKNNGKESCIYRNRR